LLLGESNLIFPEPERGPPATKATSLISPQRHGVR
jgi:hypothetical protein